MKFGKFYMIIHQNEDLIELVWVLHPHFNELISGFQLHETNYKLI